MIMCEGFNAVTYWMGENWFVMKFSCIFGENFFLNGKHYTKLYAVIVWENCGTELLLFVKQDIFKNRVAVTACHCIWIKNKPMLYLIDIENEFSMCFLFEAFVMKVQFKLAIQNIIQFCWGLKEKMNCKFVCCERIWNNFCLIWNAVYLSSWMSIPGLVF
jgi:hypothetical protein